MSDNYITNAVNQLKEDEGFRPYLYKCTTGHWTIGYGLNLENNKLSEAAAALDLDLKVMELEQHFTLHVSWYPSLPTLVKEIILNMAYNMGVFGVLKFKRMVDAIEVHNWDEAANQLLDSTFAREQCPERAKRLANKLRRAEI